MMNQWHASAWLVAVSIGFAPGSSQDEPTRSDSPGRWEEAISAFEARDREQPPPQGGAVFVGSSSIRLWDLDAAFPDQPVINRGFGGSHMSDALRYADRIVTPYRPRLVVLYEGDNDINAGKSPDEVLKDFQAFAGVVWAEVPEATIAVIAIKPSLARGDLWETMSEANDRLRAFCDASERLDFIDVAEPMIGPSGQPRPELFREDGLHLNEAGYAIWNERVRPVLARRLEGE